MNPKIYKGQQVQMIDVMGNVRFTEVSNISTSCECDVSVYLANGVSFKVNDTNMTYNIHGTIFKFI